jgi:ABC-type lipoprotein release transport system permease subunit
VLNASILMILVTLVASLIPSWRLVRLKPVEVMR